MVGFNAKDAARKLYAPKAILKRQSPCPQARSSKGLVSTVVGRRQQTHQNSRTLFRYSEKRSRDDAKPNRATAQQGGGQVSSSAIHLQTLRGKQIPSGVPPHVEGIDSNNIRIKYHSIFVAAVPKPATRNSYAGTNANVS